MSDSSPYGEYLESRSKYRRRREPGDVEKYRIGYFQELKKVIHDVDTEVEAIQRRITLVLGRKKKAPTIDDAAVVADHIAMLSSLVVNLRDFIEEGLEDY